jgi:hypothetical protein
MNFQFFIHIKKMSVNIRGKQKKINFSKNMIFINIMFQKVMLSIYHNPLPFGENHFGNLYKIYVILYINVQNGFPPQPCIMPLAPQSPISSAARGPARRRLSGV